MLLLLSGLVVLLFLSGCLRFSLEPLGQAAQANDIDKIKTLVAQGTDVNGLDKIRPHIYVTALCSAIDVHSHEAVATLLELGADPNIYSSFYGDSPTSPTGYYRLIGSPLMEASIEEDVVVVEMLLKAGADPNALAEEAFIDGSACFDSLGYNAVNGRIDIATLLLEHGADANRTYQNNFKAAYEAIHRGYVDYIVLLLENGLEIEADPEYAHYNSEIAHLAAIHYAQTDEEKSMQFYKQAIALYPQGAQNYESIADDKKMGEFFTMMFAAAASTFNQYAASQGVASSGSYTVPGANYAYYTNYTYDPNWTEEEFYRAKAKQSEQNQILCQEVVDCFEENQQKVTLADCVKETYQTKNESL